MGLFDTVTNVLNPINGLNYLSGGLAGTDAANERADKYQADLYGQRQYAKQKQYDLINSLQAPQTSDATLKRIAALEDQSKEGPLSQDPYFQGARANLVQGGEQALSSVQNQQRAHDNSGGFANQGSINDVYDRLGAQMAQLGQQSVAVKDQKAQVAAQARQAIVDNQIAFQNSVAQAKMAVESGDSSTAMQAIQAAYTARENIAQAQRQMEASLIGAATSVGAAAAGAPGAGGGGQSQSYQQQQIPTVNGSGATSSVNPYGASTGDYYSSMANQPWAYQR